MSNNQEVLNLFIKLIKDEGRKQWLMSSKDHLCRFKNEINFIIENKTLINDFLNLYKTTQSPGNTNKPNSITSYLISLTNQIPDFSKPFNFNKNYKLTRISPPDIDCDFEVREPIFEYITNKYGKEYTGLISTYQIIKARSAVQYAFKVNNVCIGEMDADKTAKFISKKVRARYDTFEQAIDTRDLKEFTNKYPEIFKQAKKIHGMRLNCGQHPAGIVVADKPLIEYVPIRRVGDVHVIEYDKDDVENIGLLKNDILKVSVLELFHKCVDLIKERHKIEIDINSIDVNDPKLIDLFLNKDVNGVFQMEQPSMIEVLDVVKPMTFSDISACNSLVRPGPREAKFDVEYARRKTNPSLITYYHDSIKDILKETYGLILYQEQVMSMCRVLCGFTATEADKVRKFIGKKQTDEKKVSAIKNMFLSGCAKIGYLGQNEAESLWKIIQEFGSYAFNKSHSVAYAFVSMQTAYLKTYYYIEFMSCLLSINLNDGSLKWEESIKMYYEEMIRKGYTIKKPDINLSKPYFNIVDDKTIIEPFHIYKGIGKNVSEYIASIQPFNDYEDFLEKMILSPISSDVMKLLIDNGCFNSLMKNIKIDKEHFMKTYNVYISLRKRDRAGTSKLVVSQKQNYPSQDKLKNFPNIVMIKNGLI